MKNLIIIFLSLVAVCSYGQSFGNLQERMFDYQVKGMGEFMARFNSEEHLNFDLHFPDSLTQRKKDVLSVCDFEMIRTMPDFENTINDFVRQIEDNDIRLRFSDSVWFASGEFSALYKKKPITLNLLLTPHEPRPGRFCWVLLDVGGKDIIQLADTTKWIGISPTDNELDFIELVGKSKTLKNNISGFRKLGKDIDYLSAFVALVQADVLTLQYCDKITYYFLNVPGYIFTVENFMRDGTNSGWLISSVIPIDDEGKELYLKTMFNY